MVATMIMAGTIHVLSSNTGSFEPPQLMQGEPGGQGEPRDLQMMYFW